MARDKALENILRELGRTYPQVFMELSYIAIMQDPEYAVSIEHDKREKLEAIDDLIEFFKKQERYEECAELLKISNRINERD